MIRGLVLGKFLPYHAGHAHLIRTARHEVDELVVLVCSIASEPIPGDVRFRWVKEANADCHVVHVSEEVPQTPEESPDFWPIWTDLIARYAGPIDRVFTSEHYGDELAARIGARHTCVDLARTTIPTSGTAIRTSPFDEWQFIPELVRPYFVKRVAILGPESTGKSTLAAALAEEFHTVWVPEYGREYCEERNALTLMLPDFDAIGRGQLEIEETLARQANRILVCDTDLLTTCTWSDMVVGERPSWLREAASRQHYDLTLVLSNDGVPWINDGTRVLELRRSEHFERIVAELTALGRTFTVLQGSWKERFERAVALVRELDSSTIAPSLSNRT